MRLRALGVPIVLAVVGGGTIVHAQETPCWRADGSPVGLGGGYARAGIRFWPDARRI
jgi:hypothetical protein